MPREEGVLSPACVFHVYVNVVCLRLRVAIKVYNLLYHYFHNSYASFHITQFFAGFYPHIVDNASPYLFPFLFVNVSYNDHPIYCIVLPHPKSRLLMTRLTITRTFLFTYLLHNSSVFSFSQSNVFSSSITSQSFPSSHCLSVVPYTCSPVAC